MKNQNILFQNSGKKIVGSSVSALPVFYLILSNLTHIVQVFPVC